MSNKSFDVLIIGGGPAARSVIHKIHKQMPTLKVCAIKDEPINANRCAIPYGLSKDEDKFMKYMIPNSLTTLDNFTTLLLGKVTKINPEKNQIIFKEFIMNKENKNNDSDFTMEIMGETEEEQIISYKYLVLATGSTPIFLPNVENLYLDETLKKNYPKVYEKFSDKIEGNPGPYVAHFRGSDDLKKVRQWIKQYPKKRVVAIGSGYINIEIAEQLIEKKLADEVIILQRSGHVLRSHTEPEFYEHIEKELTKHKNINVKYWTTLKSVERDNETGEIRKLTIGTKNSNGEETISEIDDVSFVVVSIGTCPNTELCKQSDLPYNKYYGMKVNDNLQLLGQNNIFAAGDCAANWSYYYNFLPEDQKNQENREKYYVETGFGTLAVFMGRIVADNIMAIENAKQQNSDRNSVQLKKWPGTLNAAGTTVFDFSIGSVGVTEHLAKHFNIEYFVGFSETDDKYPQLNPGKIKTKLIFDKNSKKLIGGSVFRPSYCVAGNIDFMSLAIQKNTTIFDIMDYQYSTQPLLAAKPNENLFQAACFDAMANLKKNMKNLAGFIKP